MLVTSHQVRDSRGSAFPEILASVGRSQPERNAGPLALAPQRDRPPPDAVDADEVKEAPEKAPG
jgi:hypothetical protein